MMYGFGYGWHGGFGLFPLIWLVVVAVVVLFPLGTVLRRIGFSPLWSVLAIVPIVNLVALWVLAFTDWPRREAGS